MKILVSGAGIGGSAATLFLRAGGHDVVTIDKAPAFSGRGYILSLKYFGIGIMKSLGLCDELQRFGIPYREIRMYDGKGGLVHEYTECMAEQATKGSIFLLRADLHEVLYNAAVKRAREASVAAVLLSRSPAWRQSPTTNPGTAAPALPSFSPTLAGRGGSRRRLGGHLL